MRFVKRTKGFCLGKIASHHAYDPRWDIGPLTEEHLLVLDQISSKPLSYLGSGKECYVFVSQDDKLVIKFFKQKHMRPRSRLSRWPFPLFPHFQGVLRAELGRHAHLRSQTFRSYLIAYNDFSDYTHLLYLHLNQTKDLNRKVEIILPKGGKQALDLDSMEFLVQRKADSVFGYLEALLRENKIRESKAAIGSILDLMMTQSLHGIANSDNNCRQNLGFINGQASLIDVGEFRLISPTYPLLKDIYSATQDLRDWLEKRSPELLSFLDIQIKKRIDHDL